MIFCKMLKASKIQNNKKRLIIAINAVLENRTSNLKFNLNKKATF
jgi:hypothetical protein